MLTQQLNLALKSIHRGRFYSYISVVGLSIAIAVVLLIAVLIRYETSFDTGFEKSSRIYRLNWENRGTGDRFATMFNPSSPQMKLELAEVEDAARLGVFRLQMERNESDDDHPGPGNHEHVALVDPAFFSVFDFEFAAGDAGALHEPDSIVMTKAGAERYFPGEDPMGKSVLVAGQVAMTVTGVLSELPRTTHFTSHYFVPLETARTLFGGAPWLDNWGSDGFYHYIVIKEGTNPDQFVARLPAFLARHGNWEEDAVQVHLQPLTDIHFTTDLQDDMPELDTVENVIKAPRKASDLMLFSAGALLLVLVASFNFMNLQVARSIGKGKQVGMLKVFGASRRRIVEHMLLESVLLCVLALLVAMMIVELSLKGFSQLLAVGVEWGDVLNPGIAGLAVALTLMLGLAAGAYPAFLMASQKPAQVMKGELRLGTRAAAVRHALVLLQFAVSILLVIVSAVIYAQIRFSLSAPLGFDQDNVAVVRLDRETREHFDILKSRLRQDPRVQYVARGSIVPTESLSDGTAYTPTGASDPVAMRMVVTDYGYFEALGIEMAAGRPYQEAFSADEFQWPSAEQPETDGAIIINTAAARRAGWVNPQTGAIEAVGKTMTSRYDRDGVPLVSHVTVVGVVEDVHFRSLRSEVVPMAFFLMPSGNKMVVRFQPGTEPAGARALMEATWLEVAAEVPLRMSWLEDMVADLYAPEYRTLKLVASITMLAIIVACLGLLAVATLATRLRTREVGLRKVLGASAKQIVGLLSWQFLKPVLLANLLAWPAAWIFMNQWLQHFAYRVEPDWMFFVVPSLFAALIAWATIVGQAWWVARAKPIHALRHE